MQNLQFLEFEHYLNNNINSITELNHFIDSQLISHNVILTSFTDSFLKSIVNNPNWIQNSQDLDYLLNNDAFWKQLSKNTNYYTHLEQGFLESISKLKERFPNVWKYEPGASEALHRVYLNGLEKLGLTPKSFDAKLKLWLKLTDRGVTTLTDHLFQELYSMGDNAQKKVMENFAIEEGRIWEQEIKAQIARKNIFQSENYLKLLNSSKEQERKELLKQVIQELQEYLPESGRGYAEILEDISVKIESSAEESQAIHYAKTMGAGGEKQEDLSLRLLSQLTDEALNWKKKDQWAMIQYLRGRREEPNKKLKQAFKTVGPERIRRIYQLLPIMAQTVALDTFLDAPRGLLGRMRLGRGWGKTIINDLMSGKEKAEIEVAQEILEGFLYALKATGNKALRSYILSYLLAQPLDQSSTSADVLKNVLEVFGTTGVKIGQFLVASELLSEEATEVLRSLQERANEPLREDIYEDLRKIFKGKELPFKVRNLLGAASLKYAFLSDEPSTGKQMVMKVFRLESIAHTKMEFNLLEKMSEYLIKKHGSKYGVFSSIIKASKKAVERELVSEDEIKKSYAVDKFTYVNLSEEGIHVSVPKEVLIDERLIAAEYAEGVSFYDFKPEVQRLIADKILKMEADNLFSEEDIILFDPDRHAGNYRINLKQEQGDNFLVLEKLEIRPIDFGQVLTITKSDRLKIFQLFALSQVLNVVGSNEWIATNILKTMDLDLSKLKKT